MKIGLLITFYKRKEFALRSIESLMVCDLKKISVVYLHDDGSMDSDLTVMLADFSRHLTMQGIHCITYSSGHNVGIKQALYRGCNCLFYLENCDIVTNLDADAIVKKSFVNTLVSLKDNFPDRIVSGFNCNHPQNPILNQHPNCVERKHANGINMMYNKHQYEIIIKNSLESEHNWDYNSTHEKNFIISMPSLVEHIAPENSSMGHVGGDVSVDFYQKELVLPNITLFGIDSHDKNGIIRASEICQKNIQFGDVKIITERLFDGRDGYSVFCIKEMWKYIQTDFVLLIHSDGYIQNYKAWDDSWLQYDYIGASWGYKDNMNVGNGGFTLRSKKLLNIIKDYEVPHGTIEDDFICRKIRKELEQKHGIKFAPEEVANNFSIEAYGASVFTDMQGHKANRYTGQFGFHGFSTIGLPIPPTPKIPTVKTPITFQKNTIPKNTHKRTFKR